MTHARIRFRHRLIGAAETVADLSRAVTGTQLTVDMGATKV